MIQSILEDFTILTSNTSSISFEEDDIRTRKANCCGWLQHNEGSPLYKILTGGLYEVSFNANVSSATAGVVALGLYQDGVLLEGTQMIATIETAGDFVNISFDKIIEVCCRGDANLYIASVPSVLTGTTAAGTPTETQIPIVQNANFSITKKA